MTIFIVGAVSYVLLVLLGRLNVTVYSSDGKKQHGFVVL